MENKPAKLERIKNALYNSPTIRNILKVSIGDSISKVFGFATIVLLIRGLSISDYASFTTFSGISLLFSGIVGTGINMVVVRLSSDHLSRGKEKPLSFYYFAFFLQLTIYIFVASICFLFPYQSAILLFGQPSFTLPLQLGLLSGLGVLVIQFSRSLYQAEERFNNYVGTLWLVQAAIFISLTALWMLHFLSFMTVAIAFIILQLGIGLWILIDYLRSFDVSNLSYKLPEHTIELKKFLIGSSWLIGYFLILNLLSRMDVLMLLRFKGREELAIYGVAFQYYSFAFLFLGSIHAVLLPKFSKAEMQNNEKPKAFLKQWLQLSVWLIIPVLLFDWLGKPLFVWFNGSQYEKSFPILVIFSFGIWLSMMLSPLVNIIISKSQFRFMFLIGMFAFCADILLNLLLIPSFGGIGAALAVVTSIGIINVCSFIKIWVN